MYVDSDLGEITKMEPLSTLEAVIAAGPRTSTQELVEGLMA